MFSHIANKRSSVGRSILFGRSAGPFTFGSLLVAAMVVVACSSPTATPSPTPAASATQLSGPTASPLVTIGPISQPPSSASQAPSTAPSAMTAVTVIRRQASDASNILAGPNGLTLYTHAGDSATASTCSGGCASAWPPLLVPDANTTAQAGPGVTGTFATLTRDDGTFQVTYNGLPLYGWQGDAKPGDITGDGVNGFSVARP